MAYQHIKMRIADNEWIDYCENRYQYAEEYLEVGPIGVGECHVDRRPRDFVIGLIERGSVKRLLLECDSEKQPAFAATVASPVDARYEQRVKDFVTSAAPQYRNPVDMGEVAMIALKKGVEVHFIDKYVPSGTSWRGVEQRDDYAVERFTKIATGCGKGTLVLYGALHFIGGDRQFYPNRRECLGQRLDLTFFTFDGDTYSPHAGKGGCCKMPKKAAELATR